MLVDGTERLRPRLAAEDRRLGVAPTYTSHTNDSTTPMITPARTPAVSTPDDAAMAIQKSTRFTRCSRRISATSIMPNDDRVDDHRGQHRRSGDRRTAVPARAG